MYGKFWRLGLRKFIFLKVVPSVGVENIQTIQWPNFLRPVYPMPENKMTASCRFICDPHHFLHMTNAKRQCSESVRITIWSDSLIRCGYYLYAGLRIRIRIGSGFNQVSGSGSVFGIRNRQKIYVFEELDVLLVLRAEGLFCHLDVLYGSGFGLVFSLKCWIRIRIIIKWIRIRNPVYTDTDPCVLRAKQKGGEGSWPGRAVWDCCRRPADPAPGPRSVSWRACWAAPPPPPARGRGCGSASWRRGTRPPHRPAAGPGSYPPLTASSFACNNNVP